jgi:phosphatidylglycerol:prolipoprotein diacylglycerol transferase
MKCYNAVKVSTSTMVTMHIWSVSPVAFSICGMAVYWYGIMYAAALLTSWMMATYVLRELRGNGIHVPSKEQFDSFMFWAIVSIIAGARVGHVLFFDLKYYIKNPFEVLMIRNGGLAFHGAVIGLGVYVYFFVKRYGISWRLMADVLCLSSTIGICIGRFANFVNQELYGRVATIDCAVIFSQVDQLPRYPTQIFESFFEGFINFIILFGLFRIRGVQTIGTSVITSIFCIIYATSRYVIEFYKEVEMNTYIGMFSFTVGQILCLALFLFGLCVLYIGKNGKAHT